MQQSLLADLPVLRPATLELELRSDDPVAVLLTTIRVNAGLTHAQAATKLDTSTAVVTALESGLMHLSVKMLSRYHATFQVPLDCLLDALLGPPKGTPE